MIKFFKQLLDFLYQKKCYICKKNCDTEIICKKCFEKILNEELNFNIYNDLINDISFYYAGFYAGDIKKLIRGIKYHNKRDFSLPLANFVYEYLKKTDLFSKNFVIVPVPLHKNRKKKRKYNHMELIAEDLSLLSGHKINNNLLTRIKDTVPQYGLKYTERQRNMKNAFAVNKNEYHNESILIFDDILTTGATLNEIAQTLKNEGIIDITMLTITSSLSRK